MIRLFSAALLSCGLLGWAAQGHGSPRQPQARPAPILPLDQVRPGMVGEVWTAFQGSVPEPFKVRVVSVVRKFIPKQDIILVRSDDPKVSVTGIAAGMSGSPVYVDGKLMGAIAYGWAFSKEPLAGVTPIEAMRAERTRPPRPPGDPFLAGAAAPAPGTPDRGADEPRLQPVAVPLSVSGLSDRALAELGESLRPWGLVPVRAGGGAPPSPAALPPGAVRPGAPVGVMLIRGDMSAVAMGTLTEIHGSSVLAFGHPMLGMGEVNLPLVLGEVHAIVPTLATSMKLASPVAEIGAVLQDRPSGILADLGRRARLVPVEVHVNARGGRTRSFRTEVALHRRLLPTLTSAVITSAIAEAEPDVTDMVFTLETRLGVRGHGELVLTDELFSSEGLSPRLLASSRGLRALGELLGNSFETAVVERVEVAVRVVYRKDVAEIVGAALPGDRVRAGRTVPLRVSLRPYAGREYVDIVPITVPRSLAGRTVKLEVASGAEVKPDLPRPETLRGLMDNLATTFSAASLVVSIGTTDGGVSLRGCLIPGLPPSALDTLKPAHQSRRAEPYRMAERTVFPSARLVKGKQELTLRVEDENAGNGR